MQNSFGARLSLLYGLHVMRLRALEIIHARFHSKPTIHTVGKTCRWASAARGLRREQHSAEKTSAFTETKSLDRLSGPSIEKHCKTQMGSLAGELWRWSPVTTQTKTCMRAEPKTSFRRTCLENQGCSIKFPWECYTRRCSIRLCGLPLWIGDWSFHFWCSEPPLLAKPSGAERQRGEERHRADNLTSVHLTYTVSRMGYNAVVLTRVVT